MSYRINLVLPAAPHCAHCGRGPDEPANVGDWNFTWNLGPMLRTAGVGFSRDDNLHGRTGAECAALLGTAIRAMEADPVRFRAMDPPNKWGSYDGILLVLREIRDACERYPTAVMECT